MTHQHFDVAAMLDTPERREAYLSAALETADPAEIQDALNILSKIGAQPKQEAA